MSEVNLKTWSKIVAFVRALKESFDNVAPELTKYFKLCKSTSIDRSASIKKHIDIFGAYCLANKEAIKSGKIDDINADDIAFNDKIKFNLKMIVNKADASSKQVILKHLQVIQCLIHPDDELKLALQSSSNNSSSSSKSKEAALFDSLIDSMTAKYENEEFSNPGEALQQIQSSGVIQDITTKVEQGIMNGDLDGESLIKECKRMFDAVKGEATDPSLAGALNMVESLLGQMNFQQ
jgi:hypothetical protein